MGPINRATRITAYQGIEGKPRSLNGTAKGDRVELSSHARLLDQLRRLPDVRQDLVDRLRQEIAAGTYETPQKLDAAVARLVEEIGA